MKKRISLLILCACLLLALVGVSAFATDETETSTTISTAEELATALDAGGEYVLSADLTLDATPDLKVGASNFVLDLGGHTITFAGQNTFEVNALSSVTFKNGDIIVAHSYKTEGLLKEFGNYKPVVQNTDGSYAIGEAVAIDSSVFAEQDRLQTLAAPAFLASGGSVTLDGIHLERNVSVSNGGQLIEALDGGSLSLLNSELYVSAPSEAWATIDTSVIKLTRAESVTKLVIENSFVHEVMQNCVYNGTYYSKEAPTKINSSTGAVTKVGYHLDTDDSATLCTIAGTTANTGVKIDINQSEFIWTHQGFYDAITDSNVSFNDTLTMKNSRVKVNQASNYQSVGFQLYSADLVFENCYMDMSDNIFYIEKSGGHKATTSLTLRGCYVKGSHCIRYATDKNTIFIENSYVQGALQRWYNYTSTSDAGSPSVTISGKLYTAATVNEDAPTTSYKDSKSSTFWFNVKKTNDTDEIVTVTAETIPAWTHTIAHPDGSYSNSINTNTIVASEGDTVILWAKAALNATGNINLVTFGDEIQLNITGNANPTVVDGTPGKVSFIESDGSHRYYLNSTTYTLLSHTSALPDGWTLVLESDQHISDPSAYVLAKTTFAIDLNGYSIYVSSAEEDGTKDASGLFRAENAKTKMSIYSSRPGGRILGGHTIEGDSSVASNNRATRLFLVNLGASISIGYDVNGNIAGERIDLVAGQMIALRNGNFKVNNTAWYVVSSDNSGAFVIRSDSEKSFYMTNSDVYQMMYDHMFYYRETTTEQETVVLENCNLYSTSETRKLFYQYKKNGVNTVTATQTMKLVNTNVYNMKLNADSLTQLYVEGECHLSSMVNNYIKLAPGYGAVAQGTKNVTVTGTSYPEKSRFGMPELSDLDRTYPYNTVVSRYSDYKQSIYTNVTLDTALDLHLYIPKEEGIASVLVDGTECFDATAIETLGGKEYYIVTIAKAPKEMYNTALVEIIFKNGATLTKYYTLEHSLLNYANNLLKIDEEKYSGTSKDYIVDSKNVMRYMLNYANEAIERYGELDNETLQKLQGKIATLLGDFALTEDDLVLEDVKTDLPSETGTAAAFDLDSKIGFVVGALDTFTGNITVTLGERVVSGDFVATNIGATTPVISGYVLLDGILAYELYSENITVSIVGTNGDTAVDATFTYNLATYTNSGVSGDVGKALYAYARVADTYGRTYNVSTID